MFGCVCRVVFLVYCDDVGGCVFWVVLGWCVCVVFGGWWFCDWWC